MSDQQKSMPQQSLQDYSRQHILVGIPAIMIFGAGGARIDSNLLQLSAQLRMVEAQERIAAALEQANELRQPLQAAGDIDTTEGRTTIHAHIVRGSRCIDISYEYSSPEKAAAMFDEFSNNLKDVVDAANAGQKGGQADA